jgi:membrane associated rhomboid family serine protease
VKCISNSEIQRGEDMKMKKTKRGLRVGLMVAVMSLAASPAFARSISLKEAGAALWIFIIIGAIIVLMQLVPASILFFSFIGSGTTMVFKRGKNAQEEVILPAIEPVAVRE